MKNHQFDLQAPALSPGSTSKSGQPRRPAQTPSEAVPFGPGSDEWVIRVEVRFCAAVLKFWNFKRVAAFLSAFMTIRPPKKG